MSEWKKYRRTNIAEMKVANKEDFVVPNNISVSEEDQAEVAVLTIGASEPLGMIARNPRNHKDQWYVAKKYFDENFKPQQ